MHFSKMLSQEKSSQDEKVSFIKGNELKLTQFELLSFFIFKNVRMIKKMELKICLFIILRRKLNKLL